MPRWQRREQRTFICRASHRAKSHTREKHIHLGETYRAACTYRLTVGEYYGLLPACLRKSVKIRSQDMRCVQFEMTHSKYDKSMITSTVLR